MSDVSSEEKMQKVLSETEILERALLYQAEHAVASKERLHKILDEMKRMREELEGERDAVKKERDAVKKERDAALEQRDAHNKNLMAYIDLTAPLVLKDRKLPTSLYASELNEC